MFTNLNEENLVSVEQFVFQDANGGGESTAVQI